MRTCRGPNHCRSSIHAPGQSATAVSNAARATTKLPASASTRCPAVSPYSMHGENKERS